MDNKQPKSTLGLDANKEIAEFLKQLVKKKNYKNISPEVEKQIVNDLARRLDTFIAAKIISALSDQDVLVFEKMLEERRSNKEVQDFVRTHIQDFTAFLTAVLLEFKDVYLAKIPKPVVVDDSFLPPAPNI